MAGQIKPLALLLIFGLSTMAVTWANSEELGGDFRLTDHNNKSFELNQLRGKLVLLFFGYTYCPDICPTELAGLAALLNELDDQAGRVQGVFVSLDPARDTPEILRDYVGYFSQEMIGLTGSEEAVARVAKQYKVKYQRHDKADGSYTIDHSANLYLIDGQGRLNTVVPYGMPSEHLMELVQAMLSEAG